MAQNARDQEALLLNYCDNEVKSLSDFQQSEALKSIKFENSRSENILPTSSLGSPMSDYSQGCVSAIKSIEAMERKAFLNSEMSSPSRSSSLSESIFPEASTMDKFWFILPNVLYFIPLLLAYTFRLISYIIYMEPMVVTPDSNENCLHTEFSYIILSPDRFDPFIFYFLIFGSIFGILLPILKNVLTEIMEACKTGGIQSFNLTEIFRKSRGFVDGNAKMASLRMLIVYGVICLVLFITVKEAEQQRFETAEKIYAACGDDRMVACSNVMNVFLSSGIIEPYDPPQPVIQKNCLNYYEGIRNLSEVEKCKSCSINDSFVCELCEIKTAIPFKWMPVCYCPRGFFEKNGNCVRNCMKEITDQPKCSGCQVIDEELCVSCIRWGDDSTWPLSLW